MNRGHTAADYLALIERIRAARPDIALSGDMIVGFPGETDGDFEDTMRLVRATGYAACYSFKYSPRPGTPGAAMGEQVPEAVKDERLRRLQALLTEQQRAFQDSLVGRSFEVLIEKSGRREGQMIGRSPYLVPVAVDRASHLAPGAVVPVTISGTGTNSLHGTLA